jgi:hypothetical protein
LGLTSGRVLLLDYEQSLRYRTGSLYETTFKEGKRKQVDLKDKTPAPGGVGDFLINDY